MSWLQLGNDIDGETVGDGSGWSVSLNATGDRVAIGAKSNDGNGEDSGHTRVWFFDGTNWLQLGQDLDGEAGGEDSGLSVSLNANGDRVAIGASLNGGGNGIDSGHTRVYSFDGTRWLQLGQDLDGEAGGDLSGISVSLNANGDRVAIGASRNDGNGGNSGHARVYSFDGTRWLQLGNDLDGETAYDQSGLRVSLNAIGDRVAVAATLNDGNGNRSGHTRVHSFDGTHWLQLGQDLDGEAPFDMSGRSVSLNATGDRVAIGAQYNNGNGDASGHTRVYHFDGTSWLQLGQDLEGEAGDDRSERSVSLNATGDRVAIGAPNNNGNGTKSGHTRVWSFNGTNWLQLGNDLDGENAGDLSGWIVSLNATGDRVAVVAYLNSNNGDDSGHTRVWSFVAIPEPEPEPEPEPTPTEPEPTIKRFCMSGLNTGKIIKIANPKCFRFPIIR